MMGSIVIELSRSLSLHFLGDTSFEQDSQVTSTAIVVSPSACALRRKKPRYCGSKRFRHSSPNHATYAPPASQHSSKTHLYNMSVGDEGPILSFTGKIAEKAVRHMRQLRLRTDLALA